MRQQMRIWAICAMLALSVVGFAQGISVTVDGKALVFKNAQPQMRAGRVLVPMREIFEAIGAVVGWTPDTKLVTATKGNEEIELRIGQKVAKKNGAEIPLEVAPTIINRSTMVPLRFVAESLRSTVRWDEASKTVVIVTDGGDGR